MKKLLLTIAGIVITLLPVIGQEEIQQTEKKKEKNANDTEIRTLSGNNRPNGGYFAFSVGYSEIDARHAVLFGGKFTWIANQTFGFGFGGTGFINENHFEPLLNEDVFLVGGYGGIYLEPIAFPRSPVHVSFPLLIGGGGISYVTENYNYDDNFIEDSEAFMVIEPSAEIELNMTSNIRLALGATYRFTTGFDLGSGGSDLVNAEALKGWSYMLTFKFGRF